MATAAELDEQHVSGDARGGFGAAWTDGDYPGWLHGVQDHLGGWEQVRGHQLERKVVT